MPQAQREEFRHFTPMSVHWGDMDCLGHVNNVIFFRYIESGRIAYFNDLLGKDPNIWGGEGPILADIQCQFITQLRYPAELEVGTRTARLGGKSLTLESAVFIKGGSEPAALSRAVVVWFNYKQQQSVVLSQALRAAFNDYERVKPEQ